METTSTLGFSFSSFRGLPQLAVCSSTGNSTASALPSAMLVRRQLGVYNNMFMHIITSPATCFSGMNFLLLYGAFKSLPWDYAEAVFIDGGNDYTAFFKMYLPMILPTDMVIFVLSFLGAWNDYQTFMIWLPDTPNLAYGLYMFQGISRKLYKASTVEIMAGFVLSSG